MRNFQILIDNGNYGVMNHYITTDIDLLEVYKKSLLTNTGYIVWDDGVIDCKRILGIMRQPDYSKKNSS